MTYLSVRDGGGEAGKMKNSCRPAGCGGEEQLGGWTDWLPSCSFAVLTQFTPVPRCPDIILIEAVLFNLLPTLGRNIYYQPYFGGLRP